MGKKLKGKEAEEFKANILPEIDQHLTGLLEDILEDPPAHMVIFFENNETARTHYRHSAQPLYTMGLVESLREIADTLERNWEQAFPEKN